MRDEDKTPAEAYGVTIEGDNKWITLIQNVVESHDITSLSFM
ncbi:MAG TPA: hypothetical protein VGR54_02460 [Nitrosopumilaceae archaeon]|nr:hypothetical protein [Nitrosopumilaceae archaeon]